MATRLETLTADLATLKDLMTRYPFSVRPGRTLLALSEDLKYSIAKEQEAERVTWLTSLSEVDPNTDTHLD